MMVRPERYTNVDPAERRRAQQVEHDELVGAINAVRGAARRGR